MASFTLKFLLFFMNGIIISGTNLSPDAMKSIVSLKEIWNPYMAEFRGHRAVAPRQAGGYKDFSCSTTEDIPPPKDIHSLAPKYIGVIAALGDSLTAANGAEASLLPGVALQYRGVSFSVGGDGSLETKMTLPNIIKKFNPALFGASKGTATINNEQKSQLNVGVPGYRAKDLPGEAEMLIQRLGKYPTYQDSWKLVTLFIGANDICACENHKNPDEAVQKWTADIAKSLDILASGLTKTFVNLVNVIMVGELRAYEYYTACSLLHRVECSCVMKTSKTQKQVDELTKKYQQALHDLPRRYENRSDFTVVLQPFSEVVKIPMIQGTDNKTKPDLSYLAPDCFHFSQRGHASAAAHLWNSMLQPVGKKQDSIDPTMNDLSCPDPACSYLRTSLNSIQC